MWLQQTLQQLTAAFFSPMPLHFLSVNSILTSYSNSPLSVIQLNICPSWCSCPCMRTSCTIFTKSHYCMYICLQRPVIRSCVPLHPLTNDTTHHLHMQCGSRPHRDLHGHWHHDVWVGGETECQHIWVCGEDEDKKNTDGAERSEWHVTWCDGQTDQPPKPTTVRIWLSLHLHLRTSNLPTTPLLHFILHTPSSLRASTSTSMMPSMTTSTARIPPLWPMSWDQGLRRQERLETSQGAMGSSHSLR